MMSNRAIHKLGLRLRRVWLIGFLSILLLGEIGSWLIKVNGIQARLRLLDLWLGLFLPAAVWFVSRRLSIGFWVRFITLSLYVIAASTWVSFNLFHGQLDGLLYFGRWLVYFAVGLYFYLYPLPSWVINRLGLAFVVLGLVQVFFWSDIGYYNPEGWDPHTYRLFGSLFNPNFYGLVLFFFFLFWYYIPRLPYRRLYLILTSLALLLTFSRTIYLMVIIFSLIEVIKRQKTDWLKGRRLFKLVAVGLCLGLFLIIAGLKLPGEGVKIWRLSTIKARLGEYQQAGLIVKAHPILGIGFNNIKMYRVKFLLEAPESHSLAWFSSTLTSWLVTGGLIGLLLWLWFWLFLIRTFDYPIKVGFGLWLFHAEFHSSFFYPWAILIFFITAGGLRLIRWIDDKNNL